MQTSDLVAHITVTSSLRLCTMPSRPGIAYSTAQVIMEMRKRLGRALGAPWGRVLSNEKNSVGDLNSFDLSLIRVHLDFSHHDQGEENLSEGIRIADPTFSSGTLFTRNIM